MIDRLRQSNRFVIISEKNFIRSHPSDRYSKDTNQGGHAITTVTITLYTSQNILQN